MGVDEVLDGPDTEDHAEDQAEDQEDKGDGPLRAAGGGRALVEVR